MYDLVIILNKRSMFQRKNYFFLLKRLYIFEKIQQKLCWRMLDLKFGQLYLASSIDFPEKVSAGFVTNTYNYVFFLFNVNQSKICADSQTCCAMILLHYCSFQKLTIDHQIMRWNEGWSVPLYTGITITVNPKCTLHNSVS